MRCTASGKQEISRRAIIAGVGSSAVAWPAGARAQERVRTVGVLMHAAADDPESQTRLAAFQQGLQEAGWSVGRNLRITTRWSTGNSFRDAGPGCWPAASLILSLQP